jgi:hypothetical protein
MSAGEEGAVAPLTHFFCWQDWRRAAAFECQHEENFVEITSQCGILIQKSAPSDFNCCPISAIPLVVGDFCNTIGTQRTCHTRLGIGSSRRQTGLDAEHETSPDGARSGARIPLRPDQRRSTDGQSPGILGISSSARRAVGWRTHLDEHGAARILWELVTTDYRSPIFETCCAWQRLLQKSMNHWACPILPEGPTTPLCESSAGSFAFLDVRYEKSENGRLWARGSHG